MYFFNFSTKQVTIHDVFNELCCLASMILTKPHTLSVTISSKLSNVFKLRTSKSKTPPTSTVFYRFDQPILSLDEKFFVPANNNHF